MKKKQQSLGVRFLHLVCDTLVFVISHIVRGQVWIDRKIIKRYLQLETPLYRMWHDNHAKRMQHKLDIAHGIY